VKHKVIIVAELQNGHRYKDDDIKSAVHVLESHGWTGYYKNVGTALSMRELFTKSLETLWDMTKEVLTNG
jgi:hypothetical protein